MKLLFPIYLIFFTACFVYAGESDSLSFVMEKYIDSVDPSLPPLTVIIEENISDVSICKGPNFTYYLTGTCGDQNGVQEGIKVWASKDLSNWNIIGTEGYVWTFNDDGAPWQNEISTQNGWRQRGVIAPKIYYLQGTFWITYTISNSNQSGILKSISGRAQGPFIDLGGEIPLLKGSGASLFQEADSSIYVLFGNGMVQKLNADLNGFESLGPVSLTDNFGNSISASGIQLSKIGEKYVLTASRWLKTWSNEPAKKDISTRYDGVLAASDHLFGPYTFQERTIPHAGGGSIFIDFDSKIYYSICGVDAASPALGQPCLLPLEINNEGQIQTKVETAYYATAKNQIVYVSSLGNNSTGNSWDNAYTDLQRAIDNAPKNSQIWIAAGKYDGSIEINLRSGLYLYGGFKGDEKLLSERDIQKYKVILNGRNIAKHVVTIWTSSYIRLDGLTIQGGNAVGASFHHQYGGGVHILGGGETVRLVNCRFEKNRANQDGGGLYSSVGAAPVIINCTFENNVCKNNGAAASVYCNGLNGFHTKFINCSFINNFAYGDGGAIYFDSNQREFGLLSMINCLFVKNRSQDSGGTVMLDRNSNLMVINSNFIGNIGTTQGTVIGSLGKTPAHSQIVNSIFTDNVGGTLFSIEGEAELVTTSNRLISPNVWFEINNSLFDRNTINAIVQRNFDRKKWKTVTELNESVMGRNCLAADPSFVDAENGDYHLTNSSRAKNTGSSDLNFIPFNLDNLPRTRGKVNIGCY